MKLYLVHMSSIIMLISCMSIPGITICPSLAPRSSLSMGTVHSFSVEISKYFTFFTFLELREPLEILHSLAIFDADLPTRVLKYQACQVPHISIAACPEQLHELDHTAGQSKTVV